MVKPGPASGTESQPRAEPADRNVCPRRLPTGTTVSPAPSSPPRRACDGGCQEKNIVEAYKVSSNQYFAQLAIDLGRERLRDTASVVGISLASVKREWAMARAWLRRELAGSQADATP